MLYYEDDHRHGYINPEEGPRELGIAKIRVGIPPEEVKKSALRRDQREFFQRHLPSVYERFLE